MGVKATCVFEPVRALPFVLQRFDVEAQCGRDGADVLPVEFFQDGRLPRVVQTSARARLKTTHTPERF